MLETIKSACQKLVTEYNDFWLLSAISDWSYEEGTRGGRNKGFLRAVDSFASAGVPQFVIQQMHEGINGNLANIIRSTGVLVRRNIDIGQDLELKETTSSDLHPVEVKMLFDCTLAKYYPEVAVDRERLLSRAALGESGYQIVFFTQLPNFRYPSGCWYGAFGSDKARQTKCVGIGSQFRQLMAAMPFRPTWPETGPFTHSLEFPSKIVTNELLRSRYAQIFRPSSNWNFVGENELRNAQVGVAVWVAR